MPYDPRRDDDDQDQSTFLEHLLQGSPQVVAERALRLSYTTAQGQLRLSKRLSEQERRHSEEILPSLRRIEERLGTVEKKTAAEREPATSPSLRPVTVRDMRAVLSEALPEVLPMVLPAAVETVERQASDRRWLGARDWIRSALRVGVRDGAVRLVGALVFAAGIFFAGYAARGCGNEVHSAIHRAVGGRVP